MNELITVENLLLLLPIFIIVYSLVAFCIVKIFKEGVSNLNKWVWFFIVLIGNLTGSIVFLLIGRRRDTF